MSAISKKSYSWEAVCLPFQLCTFNVYTPDRSEGSPVLDAQGDVDIRWRPGFGMPVLDMCGFSTDLSKEELDLESGLPVNDIYNSHRIQSRRMASGGIGSVVCAAELFLESHRMVRDPRINDLDLLGALTLNLDVVAGQTPVIPVSAEYAIVV